MKTVTTRRVIRPAGGPDPASLPQRHTPAAPLPALQPKKSLWSAWLDRFAAFEQAAGTAITQDLARIRALPQQPDVAEARRLQERYLGPWSELVDTFDAVAGSEVADNLRNDYQTYLELRATMMRCMIRRCLVPSPGAIAQLDAAVEALQHFIEARRSGR